MKLNHDIAINRLSSHIPLWDKLAFIFIGVLTFGVFVGAADIRSVRAAASQTYLVQAGAADIANTVLLQFAPGSLKVHRGDKVTWLINGLHNVHAGATKPVDMIIAPEVNGKPLPQLNPQIAFPSGARNGAAYQGGEAASGLPLPMPGAPPSAPAFSLVIDMKPGSSIPYLCDIHPGMAGSITVVEDGEAIPDPAEAAVQAATEFGASSGAAAQVAGKMETDSLNLAASANGKATVQMGYDAGRTAVLQFFPYVSTIKAGDSVTWKLSENAVEPHTVSFPPQRGQEIVPIPQEGKPPILTAGPAFAPETKSGATIKQGDKFSSGLLAPIPGQTATYSLTFAEPGVYPYVCNLHAGMNGVVVVLPK